MIYATATVINSIAITHKQNSFKQMKCKLKIQKERGKYREIYMTDEMNKVVYVKTRKTNENMKKKSVDKIAIIKETLKQKVLINTQLIRRYQKLTKFFRRKQIISSRPKNIQTRN